MSTLTVRDAPALPGRASAAWYWLAGLVAIGGAAVAIALGAVSAWDAYMSKDDFSRASVPGEVVVPVDEGTVVVYYEGDGTPTRDDLQLRVFDSDGTQVATKAYPGELLYDFDGGVAKAIATFNVPQHGSYRVVTGSAIEGGAAVAVGHDLTNVVPTILWALGLALVAVIGGISIATIVYRKRSHSLMKPR